MWTPTPLAWAIMGAALVLVVVLVFGIIVPRAAREAMKSADVAREILEFIKAERRVSEAEVYGRFERGGDDPRPQHYLRRILNALCRNGFIGAEPGSGEVYLWFEPKAQELLALENPADFADRLYA